MCRLGGELSVVVNEAYTSVTLNLVRRFHIIIRIRRPAVIREIETRSSVNGVILRFCNHCCKFGSGDDIAVFINWLSLGIYKVVMFKNKTAGNIRLRHIEFRSALLSVFVINKPRTFIGAGCCEQSSALVKELIEQLEVGIVIVLNIDSELHRYDITGVDFTEIPNDCRLFAAGIICVSPACIDVVADRSILIVVYTEVVCANRILDAGINGFHRIENHAFGCRKTDAADSKRDFPRPTAAHGC